MNKEDAEYTDIVTKQIQEMLPEYDPAIFSGLHLNPEEINFCYAYINMDFNGIDAYQKVFGVDRKAATVGARRLLAKKEIQTGYNILLDGIWDVAQNILPLQLLQDLNKVRDLDILDFYYPNGTVRPLDTIPEDKRKLIDGIEIMLDKQGIAHVNYKLPDRRRTAGTMLELIKIRAYASDSKGDVVNNAENKAIRDSIFGGIS